VSAVNTVLDRLDRVKPAGPGRWMAGCPCCQSRKGRPVSVRENADGAVLIHAFCGCTTDSVLSAVGLTLSDLYDRPINHHVVPRPNRVPARDLLAMASEDADLVAVVAADFLAGKSVTEIDWKLLASAAARLGEIRNHVHS
jgi:hypothetical protein